LSEGRGAVFRIGIGSERNRGASYRLERLNSFRLWKRIVPVR